MKEIPTKTLLSGYKENTNWFGVNYNMNLYKGCSHGCIYCDSRSECYHIDNFDEVRVKKNALSILEKELRSKRKKGVVGLGAMSDPYNPFEKSEEVTRGALKLLHRYGFGVAVATKSDLILRDLALYKSISIHSPVLIKLTITTSDDQLCKKIEPRVCVSSKRFQVINAFSKENIYAGILLMPLLPFLEDDLSNIETLLHEAHVNGAQFIFPGFGVTLRANQRLWFYDRLDELFPGMKTLYLKTFGDRYQCGSPNARMLWSYFKQACLKHHIAYTQQDIINGYKKGYGHTQVSLFDI